MQFWLVACLLLFVAVAATVAGHHVKCCKPHKTVAWKHFNYVCLFFLKVLNKSLRINFNWNEMCVLSEWESVLNDFLKYRKLEKFWINNRNKLMTAISEYICLKFKRLLSHFHISMPSKSLIFNLVSFIPFKLTHTFLIIFWFAKCHKFLNQMLNQYQIHNKFI